MDRNTTEPGLLVSLAVLLGLWEVEFEGVPVVFC